MAQIANWTVWGVWFCFVICCVNNFWEYKNEKKSADYRS